MALIEIARFLDLTEAQAAAAALRASGMPVFMQNENWGQTEPYLQVAMGGFRLWAPEEEAEAAAAFLRETRTTGPEEPSEAPSAAWPVMLGAAFAAFLPAMLGWYVLPFLKRRHLSDDEV